MTIHMQHCHELNVSCLSSSRYLQHKRAYQYGCEFIDVSNVYIQKINTHITQYNNSLEHAVRLSLLYEINAMRKQLQDICPQSILIQELEETNAQLFTACQQQFSRFDLSINKADQTQDPFTLEEDPLLYQYPITQLLSDIEPDMVDKILTFLSSSPRRVTDEFHQSRQQTWQDAWQQFSAANSRYQSILNRYQLTFIGGKNNRNFILTSNDHPPHQIVLKKENRLGGARDIEAFLRTTPIRHILTPNVAVRTGSFTTTDPEQAPRATLLITTVCPGGTPIAHAKQQKIAQKKIEGALNIYTQMSQAFLVIQGQNCFFPDAKNANWLINAHGKLCIADSKSILYAHEGEHNFESTLYKNQWTYGLSLKPIVSEDFFPPETNNKIFNVDKFHAYILGKNLYQYLTDCNTSDLRRIPKKQSFDFSSPVFQTFEGQHLKQLIVHLVEDRNISVEEAMIELQAIQMHSKCDDILQELESCSIDTEYDAFIKQWVETKRFFLSTLDKDDVDNRFIITKELIAFKHTYQQKICEEKYFQCEQLLGQLASIPLDEHDTGMQSWVADQRQCLTIRSRDLNALNHTQQTLTSLIQDNQRMVSFFKKVMNEIPSQTKVDSIKQAFYRVPPSERGQIMESERPSNAIKQVRCALDKWNNSVLSHFAVWRQHHGNSFQTYKQQFIQIKDPEQQISDARDTKLP